MSSFLHLLRKISIAGLFFAGLALAACANNGFPLPGGNERINENLYQSKDDMLGRLSGVKRSMSYGEVFETLDVPYDRLIILSRAEIIEALYGSSEISFDHSMDQGLEAMSAGESFLQTLYGYKFHYRVVDRNHGLVSPIRLRTNEKGFSYTIILIFRGGVLFEDPIVSGGAVDGTTSKTLFDYLNPGMAVDQILD